VGKPPVLEEILYALQGSTRTAETSSLAELIADCRDICAGVLPPSARGVDRVIDLTKQVPVPRLPTQASRRVVIDIRDSVVRLVDGVSDYGA
jgi:hypothetical protein